MNASLGSGWSIPLHVRALMALEANSAESVIPNCSCGYFLLHPLFFPSFF